jgi:hypothetical protein
VTVTANEKARCPCFFFVFMALIKERGVDGAIVAMRLAQVRRLPRAGDGDTSHSAAQGRLGVSRQYPAEICRQRTRTGEPDNVGLR